ncbi:MAG: carboxymuconolactone decarboxylase family protein [Acidobacteria bacterium]|nr:carboxymuconolactone decarboxylase family protein [Acidobacteriota bacterium]MCW5970704.1 carboxymuconolactone decarboxylase family protein [Blastocatellales bacterium]
MQRLKAIDPKEATGKAKELLDGVKAKIGMVPNLMRTFANSPAALEGYLNFSGALGGGLLSAKLREQIALTVADANSCEYCLSAHTAIGKMVGLDENELVASRRATASNARTDAALKFAHQIVVKRGEVLDSEVQAVREAGYSDGEITEIVAHVALNIFTNYFNHVAQTVVDFPKVTLAAA